MDRESSLAALNMQKHSVEVELGGKIITIESGYIAKQAAGSVIVRSGESISVSKADV